MNTIGCIFDPTLLDKINYAESKFYTTKFCFRENDIALSSREDYYLKKEQLGKMVGIRSDFIKVGGNFDNSLDIFYLPFSANMIYLSKRLVNKLIENKITGIKIVKGSGIG